MPPKTKLPEAVQRQAEEIEAFEAAAAAPAPEPTPEPVPQPDPPPAEPPPASPPPPVEDWQQKYLTLQGIHNAQTAELRTQVKELSDQVKALTDAKPTSPPAPAPQAEAPKLVTDKDVEAFGSDLVDLMRRIVREEEGPEKTRLKQALDELKSQFPDLTSKVERTEKTVADDAHQTYLTALTVAVPDWAAINADPAWLGWLTEKDPFSGEVRNDLLQRAQMSRDVARTALFFSTFKKDTGRVQTEAPAPAPAPQPSGLEREVSPGTSRTPADVPRNSDGKTWTGQEVQDFYNAVTRGDYKANPQEAKRIDAEIDKAFAEGRVRN